MRRAAARLGWDLAGCICVARTSDLDVANKTRLLSAKALSVVGHRHRHDVVFEIGQRMLALGAESFSTDWDVLVQVVAEAEYGEPDFRGATVLDLGAHKGYFAAWAFSRGAKRVRCYEPEPANFARLQRSASAHADWEVIDAAISSEQGSAQLMIDRSWTHRLVTDPTQASRAINVRTVTLADVLTEVKPDVVKIDIEGSERQALPATPSSAWVTVREVLIEVHPWAWAWEDAVNYMRDAALPLASDQKPVLRFRRANLEHGPATY